MNGCTEYTTAYVDINFQKGEERCKYCPLLQTYSRNQCMRTGELIVDVLGRGIWCPLRFDENDLRFMPITKVL